MYSASSAPLDAASSDLTFYQSATTPAGSQGPATALPDLDDNVLIKDALDALELWSYTGLSGVKPPRQGGLGLYLPTTFFVPSVHDDLAGTTAGYASTVLPATVSALQRPPAPPVPVQQKPNYGLLVALGLTAAVWACSRTGDDRQS